MDAILKSILLMSAAGSVLALVLLCIKPLTKRLFSPKWQYYIWLMVLIVMILPIRVSLPTEPVHIAPTENLQVQAVLQVEQITTQEQAKPAVLEELPQDFVIRTPDISSNIIQLSGLLWLTIAGMILGYKLMKYMVFLREIKKHSADEYSLENIPKRLAVRKTELLDAPLIVGLIKPILYLPRSNIKEEELEYILLHEMTHYKRHDLLYKWFAMIVSCIHWFNPFVYIVLKQINEDCEISCDYEVCRYLNEQQKKDYMFMILNFVQTAIQKKRPLTTQMTSSKKILKRRFLMMKTKKPTGKFLSALSVILALLMFSTTVFASGILTELTGDNYTVEITNNGEVIELVNRPFVENGEVYLPLRETFEKVGVMEHPDSKIEWDNGKVDLSVAYYEDVIVIDELQSPVIKQDTESVSFIFNYSIEIGKSVITENIEPNLTGQDISSEVDMNNAPILENSNTYIPYSYIDRLLRNRNWNIGYIVYDKEGDIFALTSNPVPAQSQNTDNQTFTNDEVASAQAVIEEYYRAGNEKDRLAQLATLTKRYQAPNVFLASDDESIIAIKDIRYSPSDSKKAAEEYINNGRGAVNGSTLDNVIVFYMDYDVNFPEGTPENEKGAWMSKYENWKMILIRDSGDGKWLIDDMGY